MQSRVPSPVAGVNVLELPLSTTEGFVLSRVDGAASVEDISIMSGIDQGELLKILDRLHDLGAVVLSWRPAPAPEPAKPKPAQAAGGFRAPFADPPPKYDPRELEEDADIKVELRRTIVEAFYGMKGRTHYELLGVSLSAEKSEIRAAYFEMSKVFHPDSQFGKQLGSYKTKMEAVFNALTEAYEVLGKKKKRAEYDEYLAATMTTRKTANSLRLSRQAFEAVRAGTPPASASAVDESEQASKQPEPGTRRPVARRPAGSAEERRAIMRDRVRDRLRNATGRKPEPQAAPRAAPQRARPVENGPEATERRVGAVNGLKRTLQTSGKVSGGGTPDQRLSRHIAAATESEQAGDLLRASHELQLALAIDPDNPRLALEYTRVSNLVQSDLADNYEKQARYEEKASKWGAAAASWMRVADRRSGDAMAAERAAENLLKADGDLHLAQKYAQQALKLKPKDVRRLALLARVYLAAGLKLNAVRELEKAATLDAENEMVKNLLREARA